MARNRDKTKESPQEDMFGGQIHQSAAPVGTTFERRALEHTEHFLRMLAPNANAYAYMLEIFPHIAKKIGAIQVAYPGLMSEVFADITELATAISSNPMLFDERSSADSIDSYDNQPDTEGRAHQGARREHALSLMLWDSDQRGDHSVSDAFGGFLIIGDAAATLSPRTDNSILRASSSFRRALVDLHCKSTVWCQISILLPIPLGKKIRIFIGK